MFFFFFASFGQLCFVILYKLFICY